MVIVFDLDDTLYEDLTYVLSGFRVVSTFLSTVLHKDPDEIFAELKKELEVKRGEVFNRFLLKEGAYTKGLVKKCLSLYRGHHPTIKLFPDAEECLNQLKRFPLYVVTDGNRSVQKSKCEALGLPLRVKKCLCTSAYGLKYAKPSPYCFQKICQWEKTVPQKVVYIADNPYKDFVGIKPLGFKTIRLLAGPYKSVVVPPPFQADRTITRLKELLELDEIYDR